MMEILENDTIFSTGTFNDCFRELFANEENFKGPLTHILQEYPTAVGKGGSAPEFAGNSDMSYFVHVLNASIIGGKALELDRSDHGKDLSGFYREIRMFFAGMVMHDVNKLFEPDNRTPLELGAIFDRHRQEIFKIVGKYLEPVGGVEDWLDDLKYLVLDTEEGTRESAGLISTRIERPVLEEIARYLKLGDQVSRGTKTADSYEIFLNIRNTLLNFRWKEYPMSADSVHMVHLADTPQTLLRLTFSQVLRKALRESGRIIIALTSDSIIYIGKAIGQEDMQPLYDAFSKEVIREIGIESLKYIEKFEPQGNSARPDWACKTDPTPEVLDRYIEKFNRKIISWSGKKWRVKHPDFPETARRWGIEVSKGKDENARVFRIEYPDDAPEDQDIQLRRDRVKLACAKRMLLEHEEDGSMNGLLKEINDGADGIQVKSNISLAYAGQWKDSPLEEYAKILGKLSTYIADDYKDKKETFEADKVVNYLLGEGSDDQSIDIPDKKDSCIQCGSHSTIGLDVYNSFGYKPTSGGGKKVTMLGYDETYNGKICSLCKLENELRENEWRKYEFPLADLKEKNAISIQIFLGDFVSPFQMKSAVNAIASSDSDLIDAKGMEGIVFRLVEKEEIQLNYYAIGFASKPKDIISEFKLFYNAIRLSRMTGFKIHISPLFNSERILKPTFTWENSPGWLKSLGWNSLRIDQILSVVEQADFIHSVARMGRGDKDIPDVLHGFVRGPRGLLNKIWKYYAKEERNRTWLVNNRLQFRRFLETNREEMNMTKMDEIVKAACDLTDEAPRSNNDRTWMIREAFEVYDRWNARKNVDPRDLTTRIAGRLKEKALRGEHNSGESAEIASQDFARCFMDLMRLEFDKRPPKPEEKRDIVAQFALLYSLEKWKGGDRNE